MIKKLFPILSFLIGIVAVTSCADDPKSSEEPVNNENQEEVGPEKSEEMTYLSSLGLTENELTVAASNNDFAWYFFAKNIEQNQGQNVVVSPLSVTVAMTMLANGAYADSPVRAEILNTLGFASMDMADVNSCVMKFADGIYRLDEEVELALANSLWGKFETFNFNPAYVSLLKKDFRAEVLPIVNSTFVADVNNWCESKTKGLIKSLLPEGKNAPDMALINATYFKGAWSKDFAFDAKNTAKGIFHNLDNTESTVDFMHRVDLYNSYQDDKMDVVSIPFGTGVYSFCIVNPADGSTVEDCINALSDGKWSNVFKRFRGEEYDVKIPKFDITFDQQYVHELLAQMGMTKAMKNVDYYYALPNLGLKVNEIIQKTHLYINEEGAEAASTTYIDLWAGANEGYEPEPEAPRPLHLDHPFIYLITERSSGAILFIGCVNSLK